MEKTTYKEARLIGLKTYQGAPCENGHGGTRYTNNCACVECEKARRKKYREDHREEEKARRKRWKEENRDKHNARRQRWRDNLTPEMKKAMSDRDRAYRAADPYGTLAATKREKEIQATARREARAVEIHRRREERKAAEKERRLFQRAAMTPEELTLRREKRREKYQRDKETRIDQMRDYWRHKAKIRRARKRGADLKATADDARLILANQGGCCAYCGSQDDLHLDHKTALSKGGKHEFTNLQWLCAFHNLSKGTTPDKEYRHHFGIPDVTPWDCCI